jgi:hypothetical protein
VVRLGSLEARHAKLRPNNPTNVTKGTIIALGAQACPDDRGGGHGSCYNEIEGKCVCLRVRTHHDADDVFDSARCLSVPTGSRKSGPLSPTITPTLRRTSDTTGVGGLLIPRFDVSRVSSGTRVETCWSCGGHRVRTAVGRERAAAVLKT